MLPRIQVASPCPADWDAMAGDNRVRHCDQCDLDVYNFSEMTSAEIKRLVAASRGQRLCGRLYRRADGTVLTRDCPIGLQVRIRRVSRRVGAALSAAMSVGLAAAQTQPRVPSSLVQIQKPEAGIDLVVTDPSGAVIPKAKVSVVDSSGKEIEGATDQGGEYRLPHLSPGAYQLRVQSPGFKTAMTTVTVPGSRKAQVTLEVSHLMMGLIVDYEAPYTQTQPSPADTRLLPEATPPSVDATEPSAKPESQPSPLKKFFRAIGRKLS